MRLSAGAEAFQFSGDLQAFEGEVPVAQRDWTLSIARRLL
jgi:hypothetical protein